MCLCILCVTTRPDTEVEYRVEFSDTQFCSSYVLVALVSLQLVRHIQIDFKKFKIPMDLSVKQRLKLCKAEFDACFRQLQYDKALRAICHAIEITPDDVSLYLNRAQCYTQMGLTQKATEDALYVIAAEPNDHRGYRSRADALLYQGEFEFSLIDYYHCIEMRPDLVDHETGVKRCEDAVKKAILYDDKDIELILELLELGVIVEGTVSHSSTKGFSLWTPPELPEEEDVEGSQSLGNFLAPLTDENLSKDLRIQQKRKPVDNIIVQRPKTTRPKSSRLPFFDLGADKDFLRELQSFPLVKDLAAMGTKYIDQREQYWSQLAKKEYSSDHNSRRPNSVRAQPKKESIPTSSERSHSAKVPDTLSYNRRRLLEATKSGSNIKKLVPYTSKAVEMAHGSPAASPKRSRSPVASQALESSSGASGLHSQIAAAVAMSARLQMLQNAQGLSLEEAPPTDTRVSDSISNTDTDQCLFDEHIVRAGAHIKQRSSSESTRSTLDTKPPIDPYLQVTKKVNKNTHLMHNTPNHRPSTSKAASVTKKPSSASRPPKTRNRTIELSVTDKRDYIGGVAGLAAETRSSSIRSQAFSRYILNTVTAEALASKRSKVNPVTLAQEARTLETWIDGKQRDVLDAVQNGLLCDSIKLCKEVLERICKGDRVSKALQDLPRRKAQFYLYIGCTYFLLDQRQTDHSRSCLASLKNAVDYANLTKDSVLILQSVRELSKAMLNMGQAFKAIVPLKSILRHFEDIPLLEADTLLCIGRAYHDGGDYLNGLTYTHEALAIYQRLYVNEDELPIDFPGKRCKYTVFTELSPRHNYCFCLCLIGRCHLAQNDKALAKQYLEHCKSLGKLWKDSTAWHTATELLRFIY